MTRLEASHLSYNNPSLGFQLQWMLLESGCFALSSGRSFSHPSPVFNRIFLQKSGTSRLHYHDRDYLLGAGQIGLLPVNLSFDVDYAAATELFFFHLTLQDAAGMDIFKTARHPLILENPGPVLNRICSDYCLNEAASNLNWQLKLFQITCQLALPLIEEHPQSAFVSTRFDKLLRYIYENINAGMSVEALAEWMHLSRSALSKGFQRSTGIPLKKHLTTLLLQKSREKLAHTDDTVLQIADELRFCDPTYFHRFFKKWTGLTPIEYRQKAKIPPEA